MCSEDEGDHLPGWPGLQLLPVLLAALVCPQRGHGDGEGEPGAGDSGTVGEQEMEMVTPPNYPVHFLHFDIYVHQIQTFHLKLGLVRKDLHWWRVAVLSIFANSTASQCGFR